MPIYIPNAFQEFQQKPPSRPQDAPHTRNKPVYGKHIQLATQKISAPKLNSADTKRLQSVHGNFLYYVWSVDPTMLPVLNEISTCHYAPTQDTMDICNQVLYYASTHPNATIRYHASNMILMKDPYAAYLVLPESRIRIAGYYYLTNRMLNSYKGTHTPNCPILTEWKTLKTVVTSSYEAETGGTFENAQNVIPLWHIIETIDLNRNPPKDSNCNR